LIYLTNGNMPLNAAYADEIVQENNSTYQLSFRFPTSDSLWEQLKEEAFLTADDLHGEQDFVIFEVEKKHGYIQVYANQVFTLLNNYVVSSLTLDRATGSTALSRFAGAITRDNPFSFFSDIEDRHTFNIGSKNAMEAFAKDKHSIIGQWGGDLVRHGYQVRLLKNGGSENESLFMYKKNLSSYQHKTSTKSLKTRITFIATVKGEGEKAPDRKLSVVVDSPLIDKYSQIYEDVIEVNDRDVKDEASLRKYGEQYYRTSLCDMMEDSLELEVVGQSDVPVQMFDIVSLFHDVYNLDVRKKITKYTYSPMGKKLKTIGFGQFKSGLANAIGNAVSDAVKGEAQQLQSDFERQLARELKNADLAFDRQKEELVNQFTDGLNAAKARAEEVKRELSDTINQRFESFDNASIQEAKRRAEEALRNAGTSSLLAQEAKRISLDSLAKLEAFKSQATSAQTALSGDLDALKRTVTSEVNQASEYRRTTTEALSRMTGQMNGFATKSEVKQGIDGLTQTFAKMKVGGRNYAEDYDFSRGLWIYSQGDSSPVDWKIISGEYNVKGTTNTWKQMQIHSKEGSRTSGKNSTALLDLEIGETYTLSFQGICYSGSPNVWLSLRANQTAPGNPEIMYGNFNLTSSWQTYQVTIPALTKPDNFDFWRIILGYNEIGHVAFRKVELTRSSTRIDAGPAPEDGKTDLVVAKSEFEKTAEGLSSKLATVETYVSQDGQRQEALRRYTQEESAKQATAVRELVTRDYVGKLAYQEDVRGIERRLEAITNPQNGSIATQIAKYKNAVDGRFADIISQIAGKANQTDFQRVRETSQLYERILGNTNNSIADNIARMALTNQLFQVEVAKATKGGRNYIRGIKEMRVGSGSWDSGTFRGSGSGSVRTIEVSDGPVSGFNKAVRIISSDPKGQIGVAQDGFEIMPGTYTMSVWIRGSAGQRVRLQSYWWSDDSTGISPEFILKDDKWTYLTFSSERKKVGKLSIGYVYLVNGAKGSYLDILAPQLEEGSIATSARPALEDTDEAIRSVQSQLAGSFAFQNLTSAGSIVSQINATNNQILIEAEKIRLKGKTLLDELTAIQGYFKRLFVGEGAFAKLNAEIIASKTITADKLVMDIAMARMFVSSDIFTDTLAAKEAFINKLRSVVVTATLLEGYKGRIGGFQIGTHEKDSSVYWITGQNQFSVGMSNGSGHWSQTALWVNWGNNWGYPGDYAWFVKHTGQMYCYNRAEFWNTPIVHGDLKVTGHIFYNNENSGKSGYWIHSSKYSNFEPSNNYLYLYYSGSGYDWIPMNKEISDRRYKHNIEASTVSGLDVVENLKTYSYRKQYDGRIEDIACGIMAQDVQKYAPEAFYENPDGAYSYSTFALVPYLIKAIQELNQKIEKLEKTA
jgi:phage minor structural protein, N-terminal domain protein